MSRCRRLLNWTGAGFALGLAGCQSVVGHDVPRAATETILLVAHQQPAPPPRPARQDKLEVPPRLPGAGATLPELPPDTPATRAARMKAIDELFPDLVDRTPDPVLDPTPERPGLTLDELTELAKQHNPLIAQAAADVTAAHGRWVQAGLYPNPTVGLQGDSIANLGSKGQLGYYFTQQVVTGGKLSIARAVAHRDYEVALTQLRKAEVDVIRQVRADYFEVLVAAETVRLNRAANSFTERVYLRQVSLVKVGTAVPFEAAALRGIVGQARLDLVQARARHTAAWRQLAATLNLPDFAPAPLAGRVDRPAPRYTFDALRDLMTARHTDLAVVRTQLTQAEEAVVQARRKAIPDVNYYNYFEHDNQVGSFQWGGQVGVALPVFDRNQGNVTAAKAQVLRLSREGDRVRNELTRDLADAFERYEASREQLAIYRDLILPDLVRAFRGVYERYENEPEKVNYNDIVTAQQNLTTQLGGYLAALRQQWQAAADLAGIVQADRIEELEVETPKP